MTHRYKFYFAILSIIGLLLIYGVVRAEGGPSSDNAANQEIVTGPEQHYISLVSFYPWVVEGEVLGRSPRTSMTM